MNYSSHNKWLHSVPSIIFFPFYFFGFVEEDSVFFIFFISFLQGKEDSILLIQSIQFKGDQIFSWGPKMRPSPSDNSFNKWSNKRTQQRIWEERDKVRIKLCYRGYTQNIKEKKIHWSTYMNKRSHSKNLITSIEIWIRRLKVPTNLKKVKSSRKKKKNLKKEEK